MSQESQPLNGYRFLIVEDEILQAQRLGDLVADMGGTVANIVYGFEQARDAIADTAFDCAILDLNLKGTLSFRLAESLKHQGIPFIFCTAYAEAADVYPDARSTLDGAAAIALLPSPWCRRRGLAREAPSASAH